ncbi:MAG: mechanosensitive ion channel family protein [Clostridia bacterium]|jgi:small conductance mechanosensitive channel|nr:mechanosensitive ion channel family protein [Clostridia bacterium]
MYMFLPFATAAGAETETAGFFQKIWASLVNWFIDERGWVRLLVVLAVILVGLILIKIVLAVTRKLIGRSKLKGIAGNFIITILKIVLVFIYLITILRVLGIDTSSFVALFTVGTLAISLAIQSVISNFASGLILVTNHPFREGDFVEVAGISGTVEKITLFATKVKTPDNKVVTVPNSSVAGGNIVNYSTEEKRRVDLTFGVAYGSSVEKVKAVIESVLDEHDLVLHDDGYTVRLSEQAASSLNFVCRCWTLSANYWSVYFDLTERMTERFAQEGIEIPYNKLDVNIVSQQEK